MSHENRPRIVSMHFPRAVSECGHVEGVAHTQLTVEMVECHYRRHHAVAVHYDSTRHSPRHSHSLHQ